jgi:sugar lactone lactonase YvrE
VSDSGNNVIRAVNATNTTLLAGNFTANGTADGWGTDARFSNPQGLTVDSQGNLYVAEYDSHRIRKVSPYGYVTHYCGKTGTPGSVDGSPSVASFNKPADVAVDSLDNIYVADSGNHVIRRISANGTVSTLAGTAGATGSVNAVGAAARFQSPQGIAVDSSGNVYVADTANCLIRKIAPGGNVSTLAGTAYRGGTNSCGRASFTGPANAAFIRSMDPSTFPTSNDGVGVDARFCFPTDVDVDGSGNVFVTDSGTGKIRKITPAGVVATLGSVPTAFFYNPLGIAVNAAGTLYVADTGDDRIAASGDPMPEITLEQPAGTGIQNNGAALTFGSVLIGSNSTARTYTLRNTGLADLTGLSFVKNGTNSSDFSVSPLGSTTLGAGNSTTFTVTFAPSGTGNRMAQMQITSNDSNNNPFTINFAGVGIVPTPKIALEQPAGTSIQNNAAALTFGSVLIGGNSSPRTYTLKNTGTADLTGLALTKNGTNSSDFSVSDLGLTTLGVGNSTTFTVTFAPSGGGNRTAQLLIANNDASNNPFVINLAGSGIVPVHTISVEQPSGTSLTNNLPAVTFGNYLTGSSSPARTYTLKCTGNSDLTGLSLTKTGTTPADFFVSSLGTTTLSAGSSLAFTVIFTPGSGGNRTAQLQIGSNDATNNPFLINLSGFGLSTSLDSDGDGLNDAAEYNMSALGFDWQQYQPSLVSALANNVNTAGYYSTSQIQALNIDTPLLTKDTATGAFELTIGVQKSTDLKSFSHFPLDQAEVTLGSDGKLKIRFFVLDSTVFFRLQAK